MELNDILLLLEKFEASDLTTLRVKLKGDEFSAGRLQQGEDLQPSVQNETKVKRSFVQEKEEKKSDKAIENKQEEAEASDDLYQKITSPIVGTFYSRPSENEEPFVKVGQKVKKGDVLCILEAMKIMNEIKSSHDGTIRKVLLSDGDMADFGKVLFLLEED
ncbi:acetyl-CoA carboxylase biotin carboxyl carrier protein [Proteiniclasticum sp. SCR006]|uniref:Biotin carboxyl carrier protein of acetyl-CoA carboxylase n=1 Tax=Proteiniclasticum aestuarii TaxID=2817862 RepID=A0A939H9L6_9CLOT|nr:acetyl-CoA carboxylase biotin carboxyl carrier protein [Proteiniclasticum aestuarii]MBO1265686.1 acetyl-CoA carboxylase biotin carboxyl carrier protein [Proteiniclasticum aestuarii]